MGEPLIILAYWKHWSFHPSHQAPSWADTRYEAKIKLPINWYTSNTILMETLNGMERYNFSTFIIYSVFIHHFFDIIIRIKFDQISLVLAPTGTLLQSEAWQICIEQMISWLYKYNRKIAKNCALLLVWKFLSQYCFNRIVN